MWRVRIRYPNSGTKCKMCGWEPKVGEYIFGDYDHIAGNHTTGKTTFWCTKCLPKIMTKFLNRPPDKYKFHFLNGNSQEM